MEVNSSRGENVESSVQATLRGPTGDSADTYSPRKIFQIFAFDILCGDSRVANTVKGSNVGVILAFGA